jgi:hypothetical protein
MLLALASACVVKDLELDTDGEASSGGEGNRASSDADEASSSGTDDTPAMEDTGASAPPVTIDDPEAWAAMMATRRCDALARCDCYSEAWSWSDPGVCFEDNYAFFWQRADWAQFQSAQLNPSCLERYADAHLDGPCDATVPPLASNSLYGDITCDLFVGEGELGEPCATRWDFFVTDDTCREGLHCTPGGCALPLAEGDACGPDNSFCVEGLQCIDGVCTELGRLGAACPEATCVFGLVCVQGECVLAGEEGAECIWGADCASLRCVDAQCEPPAAALCGPYGLETPE